jgi:hypothetical protein
MSLKRRFQGRFRDASGIVRDCRRGDNGDDLEGMIFAEASRDESINAAAGGPRPYLLRVVSQGGQDVIASAGLALAAGPLTQAGQALDTLLVAGGGGPGGG